MVRTWVGQRWILLKFPRYIYIYIGFFEKELPIEFLENVECDYHKFDYFCLKKYVLCLVV